MNPMRKSALVVVDVQNYFINEHTKGLPEKIQKFIVRNENNFDYVVFTKFVNKINSNFVKMLGWRKCFKSPEIDIDKSLLEFTHKNNVFAKHGFSAFKSQEFVKFLKRNKIKNLYICGTDTEACIFSTAVDAFDAGYKVKVLKELCGSSHGKRLHNIGCMAIASSIEKLND